MSFVQISYPDRANDIIYLNMDKVFTIEIFQSANGRYSIVFNLDKEHEPIVYKTFDNEKDAINEVLFITRSQRSNMSPYTHNKRVIDDVNRA